METRQECGPLLKQINDEMRKNANNALRAKDLTLTQLEALVQLEQAPEGQHSLKELEQILHVAQSTAAGIMSRLELCVVQSLWRKMIMHFMLLMVFQCLM